MSSSLTAIVCNSHPRAWLAGISAGLCMFLVAFASSVGAGTVDEMEHSMVQVTVTFQQNDPFQPWQEMRPRTRRGYAVVLDNSRLVTTEHLVRNHKLVEFKRSKTGEKITASVEMADCQVNLAILKVAADAARMDWSVPLELAEQVGQGAGVEIVQFDDTDQIRRGDAATVQTTVSRLPDTPHGVLTYSLQTEMSVNGQGAPVLHEGKLAGLVMGYDQRTRVARMLPYSIIARFLARSTRSPYTGFPSAGFFWTGLVDPAKRDYLAVSGEGTGILVLSCQPGTGASETLRPNDVILALDGHRIDSLGYYDDPEYARLNLSHLIKGHHEVGDMMTVRIIRDRQETSVKLRLDRPRDSLALIPENVTAERPEYLVEGGLVIRELSGRLLRAYGANWQRTVDTRLVHLYMTRRHQPASAGQRVVIMSAVLPDPINVGYQNFHNAIITCVNGEEISNMADVFRVFHRDGAIKRLALQSVGVELVLDQGSLAEANARLARLYRLPAFSYQRAVPVEIGE